MTKPSVRVVLFHFNVISDVVNLTKNLPCVDPSGRSRSTAASDTDAVRMHLGGTAHFFCVEVDSLTNSRPTSLSRLLVRLILAMWKRSRLRRVDNDVQSKNENLPRLEVQRFPLRWLVRSCRDIVLVRVSWRSVGS